MGQPQAVVKGRGIEEGSEGVVVGNDNDDLDDVDDP